MNYKIFFSVLMLSVVMQLNAAEMARNNVGEVMKSALQQAGRYGDFKPLISLIDQGFDINMILDDGNTPLIRVIDLVGRWPSAMNLIKSLLNQKALIDKKNEGGYTALMAAANVGSENNENIVRLLLDAGANPLIEKNGRTALRQVQDQIRIIKSGNLEDRQDELRILERIEKILAAAEKEAQKTQTVKQMQLPKKAIQAGSRGQMGELGKEVEKYL